MKLLLDLSQSKIAKVSLMEGGQLVSEKKGPDTLKLVDEILREKGLKLTDILEVDSFPGPGSYTGLRIGAAIANALNYSLGRNKIVTPKYD